MKGFRGLNVYNLLYMYISISIISAYVITLRLKEMDLPENLLTNALRLHKTTCVKKR